MKNLLTFATGVVLMLAFLQAEAQKGVPLNEPDHNKPQLFSDLPQKLDFKLAGMDALFTLAVGSEINILVANGFHFKGVVVSRSGAQDPSFNSIVLRSDNRKGAVFTFFRRKLDDGSSVYGGRIISMQHSDAYELSFENGKYVLKKEGFYDLVSE